MVYQLAANRLDFPPAELALKEPNGLLAVGGDLSVERLRHAYQQGIFPWYSDADPLLWWSPDPRAVFTPSSLHVSRSMRREFGKHNYQLTLNMAFDQVIHQCRDRHADEGIWIHSEMIEAYQALHQAGSAQSIELWDNEQLIAGMYGVAVGSVFSAESMFHSVTNGSKWLLIKFAQQYFAAGGQLIDAQISNPHLTSLGCITISRAEYLAQLRDNQQPLNTDFWQKKRLPVAIGKENR